MLKRQRYITLAFIAFAALNLALPYTAHAQSTCTPEQRKELILTAVDKDGRLIDNLRAEHLSLKVGNAPATIADIAFHSRAPLARLQVEIVDPEMRKAKPVLAYKRY